MNLPRPRIRPVFALFVVAVAAGGCNLRAVGEHVPDGALSCVAGEEVACACFDGTSGRQACRSNGTFGACSCDQSCVPGRAVACTCPGAATGARVCSSAGVLGPCICRDGDDAGSIWPDSPDAGWASPDAGGNPGSAVFHSGADNLIDLFPTPNGLIVVRSTMIELLDPSGAVVRSIPSPREITAAAFDGTTLGVADRAMLNVYDASLTAERTVGLNQACASAVVVSGGRFVCGPSNDWDRVFAVYSLSQGTILSKSSPYTYNGIPMRRVPGTDDFVTVTTNLSPSDYHLYSVGADDVVKYINESPYHGAFTVTNAYAFDATPAEHLISPEGLLLRIYSTNCAPEGSFTSGCFVRDGELGTLAGRETFFALTDDGAGTVYGIVAGSNSYWGEGLCAQGCKVQRIDVKARVIRSTATLTAKASSFVMKFDSYAHRLVVGYGNAGSSWGTTDGFGIQRFELE